MQARLKAVAEIVSKLIDGVTSGNDVNLNDVKRDAALRYQARSLPLQRLYMSQLASSSACTTCNRIASVRCRWPH